MIVFSKQFITLNTPVLFITERAPYLYFSLSILEFNKKMVFDLFLILWGGVFKWLLLGVAITALFKIQQEQISLVMRWVVIYIGFPIFIFYNVVDNLSPEKVSNLYLYSVWAIISITLAYLFSRVLYKILKLKMDAPSYHIGNTFHNYGFFAYALVYELVSPEALASLFVYVLTIEIILWSFGLNLVKQGKANFKKLLLNPPLISLLVAIVVVVAGVWKVSESSITYKTLAFVAAFPIPIAIAGIGGILCLVSRDIDWKQIYDKEFISAIVLRHIIMPLTLLALFCFYLENTDMRKTLFLEAIMPAALMPITIVSIYGGDRNRLGLMIVISTLLSIFTIPLFIMIFNALQIF
ncbi:MAG: AEC family transporter [Lentisphaeria bacterium]|nr:AEC family transporter [Lentisphaeria bacterium]